MGNLGNSKGFEDQLGKHGMHVVEGEELKEQIKAPLFNETDLKKIEVLKEIERTIKEVREQIKFWKDKLNNVEIDNARATAQNSELLKDEGFNTRFQTTLNDIQSKIDGYKSELQALQKEELKYLNGN